MLLIAVAAALFWGFGLPCIERRRRRAVAAEATPAGWPALLELDVQLYRRMPALLRQRLHELMQVFVADKNFVGCGGLTVTEPMRVVIAAQACALILNREYVVAAGPYPQLRSVLVYPAEFVVHEQDEDDDGLVTTGHRVLSGQAWDASRIILSWEDVTNTGDGYNVVLHEFAHYLDVEDGLTNPIDETPARAGSFASDLQAEFEQLCADVAADRETFLDPYAATDPAEFFAVATEAFFDLPDELATRHPVTYELLRRYYRVDPVNWLTAT